MDSSFENRHSRQSRSRQNSHLSSTTAQFQSLLIEAGPTLPNQQIKSSPSTSDQPLDTSVLSQPHNTFFTSRSRSSSATGLSSPALQQYTPFPLLHQSDLDPAWSYLEPASKEISGSLASHPDLSVQPFIDVRSFQDQQNSSSCASNLASENMSTIGIQQYDSRFDAGGRQQSYAWPQFEMNEQFIQQQDLSPNMSPHMSPGSLSPYDELKPSPVYARSLSDSPPRASLTPEQRELKRQRDHARRESKGRQRRERSLSNPYNASQRHTPEGLPRSMSQYSNNTLAPTPILASNASQNLPSPSYLAAYQSPQGHNSDATPTDIYGAPVYSMSPNDFPPITSYSMPYSSNPESHTLPPFARAHSLSSASEQSNHLYPSLTVNTQGPEMPLQDPVRVLNSRPKPQCWEHGCAGRQFSTFSNLLRHQREKSGVASKSMCPNCGAEFTRTTARNGHMAHEKCKRRNS